jgi:hypothetical protein
MATMTPIVAEILQTAGRRGSIDATTATRLLETLPSVTGSRPSLAPETMTAVSRILADLDTSKLPRLIAALQQQSGEPPADVKDLIGRLATELRVPDGGTVDDILAHLVHRREE